MPQPGTLAYVALLLIPPAALVLFWWLKPNRAVLALFLATLLFFPERVAFDAPLIPPLDKNSLPMLCMLIGIFLKAKDRVRQARPGRGFDILILLALGTSVGTVLTNTDPIIAGPIVRPGLTASEGITLTVEYLLGPGAAFFLGRVVCRNSDDAYDVFRALTLAALAYVPFVLVEIRLSPQWHVWIYGYRQHSFAQTVRGDSYRPMCFMQNGLALALFMWLGAFAAWQLVRLKQQLRGLSSTPFAIGLSIILVSINSTAAAIYGIVSYPLTFLLRPRAIGRFAFILGCFVLAYPLLRATELFPAQELVDFSARFSQDRAESLGFRFKNELALLNRTLDRPVFGWGGWGRGFQRASDGRVTTVVDGAWIGIINTSGFAGFWLLFALLVFPIGLALRRIKTLPDTEKPLLAGTALATAVYTVDLLPNGLFNQMPFFLAGAVAGLCQGLGKGESSPDRLAQLLRFLLLRRLLMSRGAGADRYQL